MAMVNAVCEDNVAGLWPGQWKSAVEKFNSCQILMLRNGYVYTSAGFPMTKGFHLKYFFSQ